MGTTIAAIGIYAILVNAVTFTAYGLDKRFAKRQARRIPERTLHLLALAGGSPGAYLGQRIFRHKTAKSSFQTRFYGILVLQAGVLVGMGYLLIY